MTNAHHTHDHDGPAARTAAIEKLLTEKGMVPEGFIDSVIETYTEKVGPRNGARVVAKAWMDDDYRRRLLSDGKSAIEELGYSGPEGDVVVVENTDEIHNVVVCTLCSCYPWTVLGLPPTWYKSPEYRARMVREPRTVLREMGLDLSKEVEIQVWDSSAEKRYLVLPVRPQDTDLLDEQELAAMVTRDSMIGVSKL